MPFGGRVGNTNLSPEKDLDDPAVCIYVLYVRSVGPVCVRVCVCVSVYDRTAYVKECGGTITVAAALVQTVMFPIWESDAAPI